jgi:hypothetical protein
MQLLGVPGVSSVPGVLVFKRKEDCERLLPLLSRDIDVDVGLPRQIMREEHVRVEVSATKDSTRPQRPHRRVSIISMDDDELTRTAARGRLAMLFVTSIVSVGQHCHCIDARVAEHRSLPVQQGVDDLERLYHLGSQQAH